MASKQVSSPRGFVGGGEADSGMRGSSESCARCVHSVSHVDDKQLKAATSTARRRGDHVAGQDDPVGRVPRAGARRRTQKAGPLAVSVFEF